MSFLTLSVFVSPRIPGGEIYQEFIFNKCITI
nr:MAG TPA: hypothetical protein [Caudoviricetes sp.]